MENLTLRCSQTGSNVQLRLSESPRSDRTDKMLGDGETQMPFIARLVHRVARGALKLVKSIAARLDLTDFPGSCCG